jgi:hypothetical protein
MMKVVPFQGIHRVRVHDSCARRRIYIRLFPRVFAAQYRQLQRLVPGSAGRRHCISAAVGQALRARPTRLHLLQVPMTNLHENVKSPTWCTAVFAENTGKPPWGWALGTEHWACPRGGAEGG